MAPLTVLPLLDGRGLTWSLAEARAGFETLPGYLLLGALLGLGYHWLTALARLLLSDDVRELGRESAGVGGVRALGHGALAGLVGGLVFTLIMLQIDFLPTVAQLVGSESRLTGFLVHLVIADLIGASYGVLFRRQSYDFGSAVGWGVAYGFCWWVLGALTLLPVFLGGPPQWTAAGAAAAYPALVGHLLYGAGLGASFYALEARQSPWWVSRTQAEAERRERRRRQVLSSAPALWALIVVIALIVPILLAGCREENAGRTNADARGNPLGPAPAVRVGPLSQRLAADLDAVFGRLESIDRRAVRRIGASRDARVAWLLSDLLRFVQVEWLAADLVQGFERLTGARLEGEDRQPGHSWRAVTDLLIAWDLPAPPGYVRYKARLFTLVEPGWAPFFEDRNADIDWRRVSWGGVLIDDRPLGDPAPCPRGCIPALDDPAVTDAAGGSWYPDDALVFGVVVNGRARAYPKNIMEVHELVNDTLGGRRIGMPYCTLCASAQVYFTDGIGERVLVLRTSGLLSRSNKVMYELSSRSAFDTFDGRAVSGPLREAGVTLEQITVVTSSWGAWKAAHPDTTIVARDGGLGRRYPADPLRGRDDNGPIFPVGDVDPRLPVQEQVVGVIAPDGTPLAFPAGASRAALQAGKDVELADVHLELDGDGLRAVLESGARVVSHQAFWFAWSQFHPGTALWTPRG